MTTTIKAYTKSLFMESVATLLISNSSSGKDKSLSSKQSKFIYDLVEDEEIDIDLEEDNEFIEDIVLLFNYIELQQGSLYFNYKLSSDMETYVDKKVKEIIKKYRVKYMDKESFKEVLKLSKIIPLNEIIVGSTLINLGLTEDELNTISINPQMLLDSEKSKFTNSSTISTLTSLNEFHMKKLNEDQTLLFLKFLLKQYPNNELVTAREYGDTITKYSLSPYFIEDILTEDYKSVFEKISDIQLNLLLFKEGFNISSHTVAHGFVNLVRSINPASIDFNNPTEETKLIQELLGALISEEEFSKYKVSHLVVDRIRVINMNGRIDDIYDNDLKDILGELTIDKKIAHLFNTLYNLIRLVDENVEFSKVFDIVNKAAFTKTVLDVIIDSGAINHMQEDAARSIKRFHLEYTMKRG